MSDHDAESGLTQAYKRAGISLAVAAVFWLFAYLYARRAGWEERNLFIPIAAGALSALCFWLSLKSKQSPDE